MRGLGGPPSVGELSRLVGGCNPNIVVRSVRRYTQAWDNHVFLVNHRYVVKVSRGGVGDAKLLKEGCLLPHLRAVLGGLVPNPISLCRVDGEHGGRVLLIYERVAGSPITQRPSVQGHTLCLSLTQVLQSIHAMGVPPSCSALVPSYNTPETWVEMVRLEAERLFGMLGEHATMELKRRVLGLLEGYAGWLLKVGFKPRLIHGDIDPRNILVDSGGGLRGLIDWGETAVGDPALDYAGLFFNQHLGQHVLELQREEDAGLLSERVRFHWAFVPLYWAAYGVARGERALASKGLRELEARLNEYSPPTCGW